jgi:hypothetical protein
MLSCEGQLYIWRITSGYQWWRKYSVLDYRGSEGRKWSRIEAALYVMFTLQPAMNLRRGEVQA